MMNTLFLAWQAPFERRWFPVGRLTADNGRYQFLYTKGARQAVEFGFHPLPAFPQIDAAYESETLFPVFSNRLLQTKRPDYAQYVDWLSVPNRESSPISLLGLSEGRRASGDSLMVFPKPEKDADGRTQIYFFAHGVRYFTECAQERMERLETGEELLLALDCQNRHDPKAVLIRTSDQAGPIQVGWLPRYLAKDIHALLCENPACVRVRVERVNRPPAPVQFRVLCSLVGNWPHGREPFQTPEFEPLQEDIPFAGG